MSFIEHINSPEDLKKLSIDELKVYAEEVRSKILSTVNVRGGHLASNLGCVELTIAMHYVFDCPSDKFVFDTGHQSYTHKIITGRRDKFDSIRTEGGISGFEKFDESEYDAYTGGHSGNSLSIGLGLLRAEKKRKSDNHVITVIGDGALSSGMAYEALNDIGANGENLIIILNDNKMSISKNVGAMAKHLGRLRLSNRYSAFKSVLKKGLHAIPFIGEKLVSLADDAKKSLKSFFVDNSLFESIGIKYYGPFDGHDIESLITVLRRAKTKKRPILLHVVTTKGRGYKYAEEDPTAFHGVAPINTLKNCSFSKIFGSKLCEMAAANDKIVAITAAMADGTGLADFAAMYPDRFYDVGISEQHATGLAAGMASGGLKPFFAVYSSFIQRSIDQVIEDICIDNFPVVLAIDHAGFVESDGVTHQGIFDAGLLNTIPNLTICSPFDGEHLKNIMDFCENFNKPIAIRYPKSYRTDLSGIDKTVRYGKWTEIRNESNECLVVVSGADMLPIAMSATGCDIVYATFIKPIDREYLLRQKYKKIITLEGNLLAGGLGESVALFLKETNANVDVINLGFPDKFIENYFSEVCFEKYGLTTDNINKIINDSPKTVV